MRVKAMTAAEREAYDDEARISFDQLSDQQQLLYNLVNRLRREQQEFASYNVMIHDWAQKKDQHFC